ncbi:CvpA family protein, partial [Flavobacterium bomense]
MSFLDIVLGVILVIGLFKGIKNGLFVELASLISFILGICVAFKFSYQENIMLSGIKRCTHKTNQF